MSHVALYCETAFVVNVSMCASHDILNNWLMSVGSPICKFVCILLDELSVLAIPTQIHFTFLMFLLLVFALREADFQEYVK